jgi:hypothetical protein
MTATPYAKQVSISVWLSAEYVTMLAEFAGVYPRAAVTLADVSEMTPDETLRLLPIFTPPKTLEVAVGNV